MRIFLFLSFLFFSLPGRAQVEKWFDLFTTNRLEHLAATSTQIYAAAKDALLIYTPSSGTLERLSAQGELSDTSISAAFANNNLAIIGYSTGNMDISSILGSVAGGGVGGGVIMAIIGLIKKAMAK